MALSLVCAGAARAETARLDFLDRFQSLDQTRWRLSDGWANADWMASTFRASQVAATPAGLAITLSRNESGDARRFDGGELRTRTPLPYGYFEARLRAPRGSGLVTGFFSYGDAQGDAPPQEIDVEILGRDTRHVELTIHQPPLTETARIELPFDAADGFHTYGYEWKRDLVRWYVDGRAVHTMRGKIAPIPNRPLNLLLDLWNTARLVKWAGGMTASEQGPWTLAVSCAAYSEKRPRHGGACAAP